MKNLGKSIAAMSFMLLTSLPASAQVGLRVDLPLPGLEIRLGHRSPPRMRSESRPRRPGRDFVWLRGSWDWRQDDWAWVPGRWERPSHRGSRWMRARYVRQGQSYRYEPAHWSDQRLVEGEDYRRWRDENGRNRDRNRDHDRDRDHDRP